MGELAEYTTIIRIYFYAVHITFLSICRMTELVYNYCKPRLHPLPASTPFPTAQPRNTP